MKKAILFSVASLCLGLMPVMAQETEGLLAFPTAEGYGKYTVGGRGGKVIEVTNLNDSGEGSLRAAIDASGPRTVVFRVSGTIDLKSALKIKNPYITIAGQTAPGQGICIKRYPLNIDADEVIIRYIRIRLGDETGQEADAIGCRYHKNLILDHVSASWSIDETMSIYHCENVTIQWCMITESLYNSNHSKGAHGFGGIWGSNYSTYHHNLIAHHSSRNPRWASGAGYNDYRNNVVYNWGYNSCYGGEGFQVGSEDTYNFFEVNMVSNYYKPGPATQPGEVTYRIADPGYRSETDYGRWYVSGNFVEGNSTVSNNNWAGGVQGLSTDMMLKMRKLEPWPAMSINEQTPEEAFYAVVEDAGASRPYRDDVDFRIADEVLNGYATYEGVTYKENKKVPDATQICGIIDSQEDVGGWPELKSEPAPIDSDDDGMPDEWELKHGLDPQTPDNNRLNADGYTALEVYINSLAGETMNADFSGASVESLAADAETFSATWCPETAMLSLSPEALGATLSLYTLSGVQVCQMVTDGVSVDLSFLSQGTYIVKVEKGANLNSLLILR